MQKTDKHDTFISILGLVIAPERMPHDEELRALSDDDKEVITAWCADVHFAGHSLERPCPPALERVLYKRAL